MLRDVRQGVQGVDSREAICPKIVKNLDSFKTFWAAKITLVNQTAIPASLHGYEMATTNDAG
jgi:hypothetical protein